LTFDVFFYFTYLTYNQLIQTYFKMAVKTVWVWAWDSGENLHCLSVRC